MRTSINGERAEWTPDILRLFKARLAKVGAELDAEIVDANYFTPRPYRNEYDRGSREEGFTYTVALCGSSLSRKEVCQVKWVP